MSELIIYFLPPFVAFALLAIAFSYEELIAGLMGGLLLMIYGVAIFITPVGTITSLTNDVIASAMFGYGAYIFIRGSVEKIQEKLNS